MAGYLEDCRTFSSKVALLVLIAALHHLSGEASASSEWPSGVGDNNAETYVLAVINVTYVSDGSRNVTVTERAEIAKYGEGTVGPAAGLLVSVVTASTGEPTSCGLPLVPRYGGGVFPSEPWVALIRRGRCNFDLKVENAFKSNASAVVVYNDRDSPALEKMKLETNFSVKQWVWNGVNPASKWNEIFGRAPPQVVESGMPAPAGALADLGTTRSRVRWDTQWGRVPGVDQLVG
uniref:PA domain-containing protein n=1 Tax=Timema bartmani TaxID=61472 RepID=A0A7R9EXB4_9NEOP|nr:unnamed protein product [Timema bartmani]